MVRHLELAARGWTPANWLDQYYPEDLPEEWRLSYYANEHRFVLVPQAIWAAANDLDQWLDDLTEPFGFHLQIETAEADMARFVHVSSGLGRHYRGAVLTLPERDVPDALLDAAGAAGPVCSTRGIPGTKQCWVPGAGQADAGLGLISIKDHPEPPALRAIIEEFAEASGPEQGLMYVDSPRQVFETLKTLAELMGL